MTAITAYRRTITRAPQIDEAGVTLQLEPWHGNDRDYTATDEPITVVLADGWTVLVSAGDEPPILYHTPSGDVCDTLREAIDLGIARIR